MFKHIPTGAGLGGGSSDAAFMIKLLNEKFDLKLTIQQMEEYAARLGADCAFFIQNKPNIFQFFKEIIDSIFYFIKKIFKSLK